MLKMLVFVLGCIFIGYWLFFSAPSVEQIVSQTQYKESQMLYKGVAYSTEWEPEDTSFSGDIQQFAQEYNKYLPMNTHNLVLTTGEYSSPGRVTVTPLKKGHIRWRYEYPAPKGSIKILHFIPKNKQILKKIMALTAGEKRVFVGKEEKDNRITTSDNFVYSGGSKSRGHYLFLLTDILSAE